VGVAPLHFRSIFSSGRLEGWTNLGSYLLHLLSPDRVCIHLTCERVVPLILGSPKLRFQHECWSECLPQWQLQRWVTMRSPHWHRAFSPSTNIHVHPHLSMLRRVLRPRLWRSGRFRVTGISTFTMVRVLSTETDGLTEAGHARVAVVCHRVVVSLVDGFNLPMTIIPSATNCSTASCLADLNPGCPSQLVGPRDSSGNPVGCKSACVANLDNASAYLFPFFPLDMSLCSSPHFRDVNLTWL